MERIGSTCFHGCVFSYFFLPATVTSIGGSAFALCYPHMFGLDEFSLCFSVVGCLLLSKSGQVCYGCVNEVEEVAIPESVEELCDRCFSCCISLSRIRFGVLSSLKRIGITAFRGTGLKEIHIPNGVEELCGKCFFLSENLLRITFGESSTLKRIGYKAFSLCSLAEIQIPDHLASLLKDTGYGAEGQVTRV